MSNDNCRYRIEKREGNPHGDLYEMEITTFFDVIDNTTEMTVMTFTGEYFTTLGNNGGWNDGTYSGVEDVRLAEDGYTVAVYTAGNELPEYFQLPR